MTGPSDFGARSPRRVMLFDMQATGHHKEYVQHLFRHARDGDVEIIAVVPEALADAVRADATASGGRVVALADADVERAHAAGSLWRRSLAEWAVARDHAEALDVDHCVLLDLNWFQFALGLPRAQSLPFGLSGIYFFPYVRLSPPTGFGLDAIRHAARVLRKRVVLRWMMRTPALERVFVLNDPSAAQALNDAVDASGRRFQALPDPVLPLDATDAPPLREAYDLDPDRCTFVFTGTISRRKGVLVALDAFEHLSDAEQARSALVLAGRLQDDVADAVARRVARLRETTALQVRTDFRFLADAELQAALEGCDVLLAPYVRTEGSSGLVGHAARVRRPLIGPDTGLIGELIRRYRLGAAVDTSRSDAVADALRRGLRGELHVGDAANAYVAERTPQRFAAHILDPVGAPPNAEPPRGAELPPDAESLPDAADASRTPNA